MAAEGVWWGFSFLGILNKLYVVLLNFDCDLSSKVRWGIFHLCVMSALKKVSHLEQFGFQIFQLRVLLL
jgi:hypothetical protein